MAFGSRWQRVQSYAIVGAWRELAYGDDSEFTVEDIDETAYAALRLSLIWSPQIAMAIPAFGAASAPLAAVEVAVIVGYGASYAIGGAEGAETYVDYITEPFTPSMDFRHQKSFFTDPEKVETLVQATDIGMSVINPLHIPIKYLLGGYK